MGWLINEESTFRARVAPKSQGSQRTPVTTPFRQRSRRGLWFAAIYLASVLFYGVFTGLIHWLMHRLWHT